MGILDVVAATLVLAGSVLVLYTVSIVDVHFARPTDAEPKDAQEDPSYPRAA